jgi:hypothetical protein
MKKIIISLILFSTVISLSFGQETKEAFKPSGKMHFKVYWNYHTDLTQDATQKSVFEIKRSYFGYKYKISETLSTKLTFDVGQNESGSAYTTYLKHAQLDWKVAKGVKLSMGMIGLKQFNDQENFWGYRYLFKSYQDEYKFGSSADAGINAEFKLSKKLVANFLIVNGEGYKKLQDSNGNQKIGGSLLYYPIKGVTTKVYYDTQSTTDGKAVTSLALFAGYKGKGWRFGAEYNKLSNGKKYTSPADEHDLDGISIYSTVEFSKKWELFGRFDQLSSNTLEGDTLAWNEGKNGNAIITGIQYYPVKGFKLSFNYQGFNFEKNDVNTKSRVFLNAEYKL